MMIESNGHDARPLLLSVLAACMTSSILKTAFDMPAWGSEGCQNDGRMVLEWC
jgi:hypothetical protein